MSGVVAKFFIQAESVGPDPSSLSVFQLGAVCRGELNKDWAAATPSGSAKFVDPLLSEIWSAKRSGERHAAEVFVHVTLAPDGVWKMDTCSFSYGGCAVKFSREGPPYGQELSMIVNATTATATLRKAFADGLLAGKPPTFSIIFTDEQ